MVEGGKVNEEGEENRRVTGGIKPICSVTLCTRDRHGGVGGELI